MDGGSVDGDSFFSTDVGSIFEVPMLSLLLCLQVETCGKWLTQRICDSYQISEALTRKSAKILLDNSFVDGSTAPNTLTIVMRNSVYCQVPAM
jgi:hypothetical protein